MGKYEFVNGVYPVTQKILDGFCRFHACNAQHAAFRDETGNRAFLFMSYSTPLCIVIKTFNGPTFVITNENPFAYSATTSRQFSRWLRESPHIDPYLVRDAYDNKRPMDRDGYCYNWQPCMNSPLYVFLDGPAFERMWNVQLDAMRECHANV